ncbi:MAG: hypothetical protein ACR2PR_03735 [Pseudohongiellaceae bacterium]
MKPTLRFFAAAVFAACILLPACGGGIDSGVNLTPEPFTRERPDGKIPVKPDLIREQVFSHLAGVPEGEAKVTRWQNIETDYHACRLLSGKAKTAIEQVFADCMAGRGYVYMYRHDAEQLHNDIEFEIEKEYDKYPDARQKAAAEWDALKAKRQEEQEGFAQKYALPEDAFVRKSDVPDDGFNFNYIYGLAALGGIAALAGGGGGGGSGDTAASPVTVIAPTSEQIGGFLYTRGTSSQRLFIIVSVTAQVMSITILGHNTRVWRSQLRVIGGGPSRSTLADIDRESLSGRNGAVHLIMNGTIVRLPPNARAAAFEGRPTITVLAQICYIPWVAEYVRRFPNFYSGDCPSNSGLSYSPDMRRVVHAAMADNFRQGIGIGESGFAFSGSYDGDNRAAGFTYDFGNFKLRTDYVHLPSKQDSEVWLDTYRFGILRPINDEARFFAGVDSHRNAIFAIDTNGDNLHRFGIAIGDGYAARYEYRIRL